jgi:hypothetical protein
MSKDLRKKTTQEIAEQAADPDQEIVTSSTSLPANPFLSNPFLRGGFFSFRYSYREMSSLNGKTHVRGHQYRYENGKLSSEEFEGTADGAVYDQAVKNMQNLAADSMNLFFRSFASLLPTSSRNKDKQ